MWVSPRCCLPVLWLGSAFSYQEGTCSRPSQFSTDLCVYCERLPVVHIICIPLLHNIYLDLRGVHIFSKCILLFISSYFILSIECTSESKSNQSFKTGDSCLRHNFVIALKSVILSILNRYNSSLPSRIGPIPKTKCCIFIIFDFLRMSSITWITSPKSFLLFYK